MPSLRHMSCLVLLGLPITLAAQSCDPEKAALDVFRKQGLTLLRPARSYVEVGAIVVQPSSGQPRYLDPRDPVPTEGTPTVDFDAVIMSEAQKRETTLGLALSVVAQLVTVPIGLNVDRSRDVTLSQIDTGGIRLRDKALEALIRQPATAAKLKEHLTPKAKRKVYIIQEVYRSAAMSVAATTGSSLSVGAGGGDIPECTPSSSGGTKGADSGGVKTAAATPKATPDADVSKRQDLQAPVESAPKPNTDVPSQTSAEQSKAEAKNPEKPTAGIGVCFANRAKTVLSFTSDSPVPFAVRLAEIELVGDDLRVKIGDFKFPGSLGTSDVERTTAVIEGRPEVRGLVRETQ